MTYEDIYKLQLEIINETSSNVWANSAEKHSVASLAFIEGVCRMTYAVLELLEAKEMAK